MLNVRSKRCSRAMTTDCSRRPTYNFKGFKTQVHCRYHAEEGMMNVHHIECCLHDSCIRHAYKNFRVKNNHGVLQAACLGIHRGYPPQPLFAHDSCMMHPSFNNEGSKTLLHGRKQAKDGIVNVCSKRFSHNFCMIRASYNIESVRTLVYCAVRTKNGVLKRPQLASVGRL